MKPTPTDDPAPLAPLSFPLRGSRLIEASAGTGKTWTIAALYLRLILGHGGEAAFTRELVPPEILVVTFTDAATKELRDRIRVRLTEAAAVFQDPDLHGDELLEALRADYPQEIWPQCARRLQQAAEWMDEAAVSTIHGWCNRMLREHAFASESLFSQKLETDLSEEKAEAVRDYWRNHFNALPRDAAQRVESWWKSPKALQDAIRNLLPLAAQLCASPDPQAVFERERAKLAALKAPWFAWVDELRALLDEARDAGKLNKTKFRSDYCEGWLARLAAWRDEPLQSLPDLSESAWTNLSPEGFAQAWKGDEPAPMHPALAALEELRANVAALPDARADLLRHAARWIADRFAATMSRRAQMGFDELLTRLAAALDGPNAERLADAIRKQFPVALIDEFQDTDPVQYRIFDSVYRIAANDPCTALVLIGDPKQAIYSFRGADLHTYLVARQACAGRLYSLATNYRSSAGMVEAVNAVFELAEERPGGQGAFLFGSQGENPVPFTAARAAGRSDVFTIDGQAAPALSAWVLPEREDGSALSADQYKSGMAAVCASEIVRLLNLGGSGLAGFDKDGELTPLRPADIAVLVNNRFEADAIRSALAARELRCVYLSDLESVFLRPEAAELQLLLAACAEPDDGRALRAALATGILALDWASLDRNLRDERAWDERVGQFRAYRECWRHQGVLPMLRRLLGDFEVPARLLASSGGERRLTDLLHLAELLQQASALLDGEHALIRYLAEQRMDEVSSEARQIRLESDADLIRIVTIHKSKGLEYPLVFLPFACAHRKVGKGDLPLKWHDEKGDLQLTLDGDAKALAAADQERLAEDLRKFYVALTRARHATWIGLAPIADLDRCAIGSLLGGDPVAGLAALAEKLPDLGRPGAEENDEAARFGAEAPLIGPARTCQRRAHEPWWIASYSALHRRARAGETAAEEDFRELARIEVREADSAKRPAAGTVHAFPRGAAVGTFLHELLEWIAGRGFAKIAATPELLRDAIARRCALRGWEAWIDILNGFMVSLLQKKLEPAGFALVDLERWSAEMEFWFASHEVDLAGLDSLICRHTLGGAARPAINPGLLNGMIKGFIDLIAVHEGRYYVIDYKSNWLGPDDEAYTPQSMGEAVLAERYDLQYVLYLVALHRLLKLRLPGYTYERDVGGVLYLFLRGRAAHFERPPRELIETLDSLFARAREAA